MQQAPEGNTVRNLDDAVSAQAERLARRAAEQAQEEARKKLSERSSENVAEALKDPPQPAERKLMAEIRLQMWSDGNTDVSFPVDPAKFAELIKIQVQMLMEYSGQVAAKNVIKEMQAKAPRDHFVQRLIAVVRKALNV